MNKLTSVVSVSAEKIPKSVDVAMDASASASRPKPVGVSVRNGPADDSMDIDQQETNGAGKRKSRGSMTKSYKDASDSDDEDIPLVGLEKAAGHFSPGSAFA
jgi:DNA topoisomerase-1